MNRIKNVCIITIQKYKITIIIVIVTVVHKCPRHFVCATSNSEAVYYEEPISGRLSVTHCTGTLQQSKELLLLFDWDT